MNDQKQPKGRCVAVGGAQTPNPEMARMASRIERVVTRQPQDQVRCIHLFDDFFRCNWWSPQGIDLHRNSAAWVVGALSRVRKSCFVAAKFENGRLVIEEVDAKGSRCVLEIDRGREMEFDGQGAFAPPPPAVGAASRPPQTPYSHADEAGNDDEALL